MPAVRLPTTAGRDAGREGERGEIAYLFVNQVVYERVLTESGQPG